MATYAGAINQDLVITEPSTVAGLLNGSVQVRPGATLSISGSANGAVSIGAGAEVDVHGSLTGDVTLGGELLVAGSYYGRLSDQGGRFGLAVGSAFNRAILQEDGSLVPVPEGAPVNASPHRDVYLYLSADGRFVPRDQLGER